MEKRPTEKFRTSVGGQALIEGIMMRGPKRICVAVRRPDGEIELSYDDVVSHWYNKTPLVRGVCSMIESLCMGYKYLMYSANVSVGEDEEPEDKLDEWLQKHASPAVQSFIMGCAAVLGGMLAIVLFTVLPTLIVGGLGHVVTLGRWPRVILEGAMKIALFVAYLFLCTRMKEIHRVFEYHGAEHKTIACYEAAEELTVENVRKHIRFHPRCGTSFMILVLIVSIFLYSVLPWSSTLLRVVYKLLLLPVVMGISYELIKWAGRTDNILTHLVSAPGLWLQRLTTFEPDDSMIEVAIAAIKPVLPQDPNEGKW